MNLKSLNIIISGIFLFAVLANRITKYFGLAKWHVSLSLLVLAVLLYLANALLIRFYITKRTPELASDDYWELTAGLGIVPKWVSVIGLLAISAIIVSLGPWIIMLFLKMVASI
jgi:hypothetical protein